jgi:hypothetical protein
VKNRRGFLTALTAVSGTALGLAAAAKGSAQSSSESSASPPPATKAAKKPTPAALAVAATFRAFDPRLSDAEVRAIAVTIDENRAGAVLNPKKKPLHNWNEIVARFAADETLRG